MTNKICPKCNSENPLAANFCRLCGYNFPEDSRVGVSLRPTIKALIVVDSNYTIGSVISIMWEVDNATTITINGDNVTNSDSYEYLVQGDDNLEFIASNDYGDEKKKVSIIPLPAPRIISFSSNRTKIKAGERIKLSWNIRHTETARLRTSLSSKEIPLIGRKKLDYVPKVGEILTLVCYAIDKKVEVTQDLEIDIIESVTIDSFSSNQYEIIESMPIKLTWRVRNATSVIILPNNIDVTDKDSIILHPYRSTEYQLKASNEISSTTEIVSVKVKPLPKLTFSMPDCSSLLKFPVINLDFSKLVSNITEINIDKWVMSPLSSNENNSIFHKIKRIIRNTWTRKD